MNPISKIIVLSLTLPLLVLAGQMRIVGGMEDSDVVDVRLRAGSDSCVLHYSSDGAIDPGRCRMMTNSRNVRIICTPRKHLCKTVGEVRNFITQPQEPALWDYQQCLDNSGGVTIAMRECNGREWQAQDRRLNRNYRAVLRYLSRSKQRELKAVQRAWISYRDAKCRFEMGLTGGSIDVINSGSCMIETTKRRADELDRLRPE